MDRVAHESEPFFLPFSRIEIDRSLDRLYSTLADIINAEDGGIVPQAEREVIERVIIRLVLSDTMLLGAGVYFHLRPPADDGREN